MPAPTHIRVTAPPDRAMPIHPNDGVEPGGGILLVVKGKVSRVRYSQMVRRACTRGDLIPCTMDGAACAVELAMAPDSTPTKEKTP